MRVPKHDVLAAGFPCQPFSKSGFQRGMDEARGTLFWNICEILRVRKPTVVLLENVRNIAGPRHTHEWEVIIRSLRELGYRVSSKPTVFSPHLLPPERGGRPQVRERVFIMGTYVGTRARPRRHRARRPSRASRRLVARPLASWMSICRSKPDLDAQTALPLAARRPPSRTWIDAWNDFVVTLRANGVDKLPGFPVWVDAFDPRGRPDRRGWDSGLEGQLPAQELGLLHRSTRTCSRLGWSVGYLRDFPPSRRKFEWQAQDARLTRRDRDAPASFWASRKAGNVRARPGRDHADEHPR